MSNKHDETTRVAWMREYAERLRRLAPQASGVARRDAHAKAQALDEAADVLERELAAQDQGPSTRIGDSHVDGLCSFCTRYTRPDPPSVRHAVLVVRPKASSGSVVRFCRACVNELLPAVTSFADLPESRETSPQVPAASPSKAAKGSLSPAQRKLLAQAIAKGHIGEGHGSPVTRRALCDAGLLERVRTPPATTWADAHRPREKRWGATEAGVKAILAAAKAIG